MNTDEIIQNAVTHYEAFSWTSRSGLGTTKFQAVFNYEHNSHTKGYPYLYITDPQASYDTFTNRQMEGDLTFDFCICAKWDVVDLSQLYTLEQVAAMSETDKQEAQKKEAMQRLREAFNEFKRDIVQITVFDAIFGSAKSWIPTIEISDDNVDELNLFRKTFRIILKEYLNH